MPSAAEVEPRSAWAALPGRLAQMGNHNMAKVAWLGLGVMGYPMAGYLKTRGGHDVVVYNRTSAKAEKWKEQFGEPSPQHPRKLRATAMPYSPASATTTTCGASRLGRTAPFQRSDPARFTSITRRLLRRSRANCRRSRRRGDSNFSIVRYRVGSQAPRTGR